MSTYLDKLLAGAHRRVADARAQEPLEALQERAESAPRPPSFRECLVAERVSVIAEVKRASPSKGAIRLDMDAAVQARAYIDGGAAAVSVLTEPDKFNGSLQDLADVTALQIPALRKDFMVDPYQVWEARAAGAGAILLIVAALDLESLQALNTEARRAGLDVLVEVHDDDEIATAAKIDADIVGVNSRDLRTFEMDPDAFARLRPQLPEGALAVAESGINGPDDVIAAVDNGADAVLVGESVVRAEDPAAAVRLLAQAGKDHAS